MMLCPCIGGIRNAVIQEIQKGAQVHFLNLPALVVVWTEFPKRVVWEKVSRWAIKTTWWDEKEEQTVKTRINRLS